VDVKGKLINALQANLTAHYIRLEEDDGISGFVVSPQFEGMSTLDRQGLIEHAISNAPEPLTSEEQRQILMIAGLTPAESDAVGAGIRVHRLRELSDGTIEVLLHGGTSDAEYVRGAFKALKGVQTTEPEQSAGARGILMLFRARGTPADPLTKDKVVRVLKSDPYITLMPGA
jgi:hypothetical protein